MDFGRMSTILLPSRYKDVKTIFDTKTDTIETNSLYTRMGYNEDESIAFIDFEGGPFLEVGCTLNQRKITSFEPLGKNKIKVNFE